MASKRSSVFRMSSTNTANGSAAKSNGAAAIDKDFQAPNSVNAPKVLKEIREQIKKGLPVNLNTTTVSAIIDLVRHKEALDDRKLLLEHALSFVSKLEDGTLARTLKDKIVQLLYNDLSHPPATSISNKYAWRTADGSYNNIDIPDLGKAGTPYSRSVQQSHPLPRNQLPDAGLIFDTLLRREGFVKHPGGLSSLMFSFAALVIHSVFRTSHRDWNINETSSYVDLAPLYGNSQKDQDRIRKRDGYGTLYPDVFAEDRLLLLPPAVCVLLVLFNRNHNYIAAKLLEINERGTYVDPATVSMDDPASKAKILAQEEEIFQIARLINCGWFGMIVFSDYFSTILGLVRDGSSWSLTPFDEIRLDDHSCFERGKGNQCSVEFNCLYRWHATTSQEDEQWTSKIFDQLFEGKPSDEVTVDDFKTAAMRAQRMQPDITHWTFGGLQRKADGSFSDDDLANVLQNATEHPAGAFRARGTPSIMRLNEVMGIEQNRKWGVCSLNDFRKYLGLKPFSTFLEWNSNPEIAEAAEKLYGNIEYLELYVGLQAEEAKPLVDGAGLCPGYTISRAILSDAIALTRGDRFFTHDFTPYNLTAWGFADCQRDPNAFGFGSTLGRLLLRVLPNNYTENSIYTFFPLMTPESMKTNLTKLGVVGQYDLNRPQPKSTTISVEGHARVSSILNNTEGFVTPYKQRVDRILRQNKGFFPIESEQEQRAIISALCGGADLSDAIGNYFYQSTKKLINANSYNLVGGKTSGIDIVKQVLTTVPVYWVATDLAGIQLRTTKHNGPYTAAELFIFLDVEASKIMVLQEKVKSSVHKLLGLIREKLGGAVGSRMSISGIVGTVSTILNKKQKTEYNDIVKRLYELGHSTDKLANTILALMVVSGVELSLAATNTVNFYVASEQATALSKLAKAAEKDTPFHGYVYEALRLDPTFRGVFRISTKDQVIDGQNFKNGDRVFLNTASANVDEYAFSNPTAIDLNRSTKGRLYPDGVFKYLGEDLTIKIVSQILRGIFEFDNVRLAPGQSGVLQRFKNHTRQELCYAYLDNTQLPSEWPTSMSLQFDTPK
ncbi:Linoleate 10R-lipoxygenase [Psilocybe cubensis]|uniref:Linoleate diol synthase n=2 Tax=Psilocybe cubensis TaxID=181762 RepID=A0A8H7XVE8_PSICU|nr:Linoleate 10R-lipoxygenase [Psilocybe cubensis]KAH9479383.1 Linoleate 10R-lipoxygenase [Psilocybe cubensis]